MKMLMIDVENRKVKLVEANTLTDYYKLKEKVNEKEV